MAVSEAQKRAIQKYYDKNKEKRRYLSLKSSSKTFINKYSSDSDLKMLLDLIYNKLNINDTCGISNDNNIDDNNNIDDKSYTGDSNIDDKDKEVLLVNKKSQDKLDNSNEKVQAKDINKKRLNKQDRVERLHDFVTKKSLDINDKSKLNDIRNLYCETYGVKRTACYEHFKEYKEFLDSGTHN